VDGIRSEQVDASSSVCPDGIVGILTNRVVIDAALPKMAPQFDMLEGAVAGTGYLVGGSFTLADIDLLPILYYLDRWPESAEMLRQRTSLKAYLDRHMMRPSVERTNPPPFPDRNPAARSGD
jgi:glutathione S-transferase